jgi:hypothetical protein
MQEKTGERGRTTALVTVRMPLEMAGRLESVATTHERSRHSVAVEALTLGLDSLGDKVPDPPTVDLPPSIATAVWLLSRDLADVESSTVAGLTVPASVPIPQFRLLCQGKIAKGLTPETLRQVLDSAGIEAELYLDVLEWLAVLEAVA